jgi:hypothetical protein
VAEHFVERARAAADRGSLATSAFTQRLVDHAHILLLVDIGGERYLAHIRTTSQSRELRLESCLAGWIPSCTLGERSEARIF